MKFFHVPAVVLAYTEYVLIPIIDNPKVTNMIKYHYILSKG